MTKRPVWSHPERLGENAPRDVLERGVHALDDDLVPYGATREPRDPEDAPDERDTAGEHGPMAPESAAALGDEMH